MMLDFGEAVRRFYGNYINADGRAQRSAYWWVQLYQFIIYGVLIIVFFMADGSEQILEIFNEQMDGNTDAELGNDFQLAPSGSFAILFFVLFALANFLPNIMLQIRRFHDLGQSGWLVLLFFVLGAIAPIALISMIVQLVWYIFPGTSGSNQYGLDPLSPNNDLFG